MTKYLEKISQDFIDKKLSRRVFLRSVVTAGVATTTAYGMLKLLEAPEAHAQFATTFALGEEDGATFDNSMGFDEVILNPTVIPADNPATTQQFGEESGFFGGGDTTKTTWWRGEDTGTNTGQPTTLALGEEDSTSYSSFGFGGTFNDRFNDRIGSDFWSRFNRAD